MDEDARREVALEAARDTLRATFAPDNSDEAAWAEAVAEAAANMGMAMADAEADFGWPPHAATLMLAAILAAKDGADHSGH